MLKWTITELSRKLEKEGVNMNLVWSRIYDQIIKTFISVDHHIQSAIQKIGTWNNNAFELYGFDILID